MAKRIYIPEGLAKSLVLELENLQRMKSCIYFGNEEEQSHYRAVASYSVAEVEAARRLERWNETALGQLLQLLRSKL